MGKYVGYREVGCLSNSNTRKLNFIILLRFPLVKTKLSCISIKGKLPTNNRKLPKVCYKFDPSLSISSITKSMSLWEGAG